MKNDITKTFEIGMYKIYFDTDSWKWRAVNIFGFGVASDTSLIKLKKLVKTI